MLLDLTTLIRDVFFALLAAGLLILAFPPFDLTPLAWFALVPLFVAIRNRSPKAALGLSFLTGIGFFMGVTHWINIIDGVKWTDFLLAASYLASYFGLFGLLSALLSRRYEWLYPFTAPVVWVSVEYFRSNFFFLALPLALLGHSQYLNPPLIQISSITGHYGVSFLLVMVNATLSDLIVSWTGTKGSVLRPSKVLQASVVALLVGLSALYGLVAMSGDPPGDQFRITVIQGNIPVERKWSPELQVSNLNKHVQLTRDAAASTQASLIAWPESTVQGPLLSAVTDLARDVKTHLVVGSSHRPKMQPGESRKPKRLNSAFLISPTGRLEGQYSKIQLFPFGEYLPYVDAAPWPSRWTSMANYTPGTELTLFNLSGTKFAVLICWETFFPDLFRRFVDRGARLIVNISDEAWFGETAAPYHFVAMSVFRAVENRISIARAANTGISGFVDPYGRLIGTVRNSERQIFVDGYLTRDIPLSRRKTFYTRYGDLFAYLNVLLTISLVTATALTIRSSSRPSVPA